MEKLNTGDVAPAFEGVDQDGRPVSLAGLLAAGEKDGKVILYFYPKDNTTGCTAEACSLRDGYPELVRRGFTVVGVSPDSEASHRKFIQGHGLPFRLIADRDKAIATAYGVWGEKKFMGRTYMGILRTTYVIGPDGRIEKRFDKVDTKDHFNQILASYNSFLKHNSNG